MKTYFARHAVAASAAVVLGLVVVPVGAQEGNSTRTVKYQPKKLADGQPDMQGTYVSGWGVPNERFSEAERKAWNDKMESYRGKNPGAYGQEWTESELRKGSYRPPAGTVMVIEPASGRV